MRIVIRHVTHYRYDRPATHGLQRLRLTPRACATQNILEWGMEISGARVEAQYEDHNHNSVTLISFGGEGHEIEVIASGVVETIDCAGVIGRHTGFMPLWALLAPTDLTRPGVQLRRLAGRFAGDKGDPLAMLHQLSDAVKQAVTYETGRTDASTTAEAALCAGHGVCQDHAHIFIGAARLLGIPARYVSGYLLMEGQTEQMAGHAWAEAHVEGLGWVGFDVSNAISPDERYVRLAVGADYRDAAPITGIALGYGESHLSAELSVELSVAQQQ